MYSTYIYIIKYFIKNDAHVYISLSSDCKSKNKKYYFQKYLIFQENLKPRFPSIKTFKVHCFMSLSGQPDCANLSYFKIR